MAKKTLHLALSAIIAALYVILTFLSATLGLASGMIQLRLSEALCVLPCLTFSGVPGLFLGCFLANLLTGCALTDILFGSLATLLGALGTRWLSNAGKKTWICLLPPVLSNTLIVPWVLKWVYGAETALPLLFLSVFSGEFLSCFILGGFLEKFLRKAWKSVD